MLVEVPAVIHLPIPPDKLLPKFKDWLLFLESIAFYSLPLFATNKDLFLLTILGSLDQSLWVSGAVLLAGLCLDLFSIRCCHLDQLRGNRPAFSILLDIFPSLIFVLPTVLPLSDMKAISLQFGCFMNPV